MDYSSKEVELGVTRVNEAKETFDEISKLIVQIGYAVNEVVAAIGNVESYVDSLVHSSTSIENMVKKLQPKFKTHQLPLKNKWLPWKRSLLQRKA